MPNAGQYPIVQGARTLAGFMGAVVEHPKPEGELNLVRWMQEGGLRSSYYRDSIPDFAAFVGLVDANGATDRWLNVRDAETGRVAFAEAVSAAYSGILQRFGIELVGADDRQRVSSFIRTSENVGTREAEDATDTLIRAFAWASGDEPVAQPTAGRRAAESSAARPRPERSAGRAPARRAADVRVPATGRVNATLAVNLQIVLPADATDEQYDAMLSSVARHLRPLLAAE